MLLELLRKLLRLKQKHRGGLNELPPDERDLKLEKLGGIFGYTPKHERYELKTITVKNQAYNTCSFNSAACAKEIDEQVPLSARYLVIKAKQEGLIEGDGFANLRSSEKMLLKYGCCRAELLLDSGSLNWVEYSDPSVITQEMDEDAAKHKTKSYFAVSSALQAVEQIEAGHPVKLGVSWRTSMNMSGGFSIPWLLNFLTGHIVGGHAFFAMGFDLNYNGRQVLICQNSYSKLYGDNGKMYLTFEDANREIGKFGAFVNIDLPVESGRFLTQNNGKLVKVPTDSKVWLIEGMTKKLIPDVATMLSWGYADENIVEDNEYILPSIQEGEPLDFWKGKHVLPLKMMILRQPDIKELFKKYFSELFNV